MLLEGTVLNGTIVLDGNAKLPEGARVVINLRQVPESIAETHENGLRDSDSAIEFEKLLDELADGLSPLPALPAEFSRADIYSDHD